MPSYAILRPLKRPESLGFLIVVILMALPNSMPLGSNTGVTSHIVSVPLCSCRFGVFSLVATPELSSVCYPMYYEVVA